MAGGKWQVSVKEKKDFASSLEVCGTRDAFLQSIDNSLFIILHSIAICYTLDGLCINSTPHAVTLHSYVA